MPRRSKRTMNGEFATKKQIAKEKLTAVALFMLTTAFTYGVSLSPTIHTNYFTARAEGITVNTSLDATAEAVVPSPIPVVVEATESAKTQKQEIIEYIVEVFGEDAAEAITIIRRCENSSFNPEAENWNRNGTWDAGIFQINEIHGYTIEEMKDYRKNIDAAKKIFDGRGWTAWACSEEVGIKPFWK